MLITKILQERLDANNCQQHDIKTDTEWFNEQMLLFVQKCLLPLCKKPHTCTITYQIIYSNLIDHFSQSIDTFSEKDIPDMLSKANYMMLMIDIPSMHGSDAVFCAAYMLKHGLLDDNPKTLQYAIDLLCRDIAITPLRLLEEPNLTQGSKEALLRHSQHVSMGVTNVLR
tara:strand:+ start:823 stop:1332 length:510 start_codon:yes stop_codon:yes gene_type:complete